jgi:hypothetical protein
MTLHEYTQEVVDYLCKKLPNVNVATILEIAEFFTMKTNNYSWDEIKKNNASWYNGIQKHDEFLHKIYERK